jgi:hypothetical protein
MVGGVLCTALYTNTGLKNGDIKAGEGRERIDGERMVDKL